MRSSLLLAGIAPAWLIAVLVGGCNRAAPVGDGAAGRGEVAATSDARPGATDPALDFARWPDDELFATTPPLTATGQPSSRIYQTSTDLTTLSVVDQVNAALHDAADAEVGRFLTAERDDVAQAYRDSTGSSVELGFFGHAGTPVTIANLAPRQAGCSDFFDTAGGDLDGLLSTDADRRDELVVAHAWPLTTSAPSYKVQLSVLDFRGATEVDPTPTRTTVAYAPAVITPPKSPYPPNVLAVATGDFDGLEDSRIAQGTGRVKEIALAYFPELNVLRVDLFAYFANADMAYLKAMGSTLVALDTYASFESLSSVAADFDGDGRDELAIGTSHYNQGVRFADVRIFNITGNTGTALSIAQVRDIPLKAGTGTVEGASGPVQLASGLFTFDANPLSGWSPQRRQLAIAYRPDIASGMLSIHTIDLNADLTAVVSSPLLLSHQPNGRFALVAGGLRGALVRPPTATETADPTWSLALMAWDPGVWSLTIVQPGSTVPGATKAAPLKKTVSTVPITTVPTAASRLPFAAIDADGDSVYLGAPVHFTVQNLVSTDFMLGEPPKHAYWDKGSQTVVNVSRFDEFNLSISKTEQTTVTASGTDNVAWAGGQSMSASASATVSTGCDIGIASVSASISTEIAGTIGYDYSGKQSTMNSSFSSRTAETTLTTSRDDVIVGRIQAFDIWRYRVYGSTLATPGAVPFFDFVVPGPFGDLDAKGGGMNFDWYQPRHENGNILSYPPLNDPEFANPPDVGFATSGGQAVPAIINEGQELYSDGQSGSELLKFSEGGTEEVSFEYNHTLSENASIKTTASVEASAFGTSVGASGSIGFESHGSDSWGQSGVNNTTTSSATGLTLSWPPGDSPHAYAYYPKIYVARDGSMKANYAVNPLRSASGQYFWGPTYQKPDLALNLPNRFWADMGVVIQWHPTTTAARKLIRGFFVTKYDLNPVSNRYDLIPSQVIPDPTTMDNLVRLQVRVYNYSTGAPVPADAAVCFYSKELSGYTEVGELVEIGCTQLPSAIPPQGFVTAEVPWNTRGASGGTAKDYRIYVRLDTTNLVDETYDNAPDWVEAQDFCDPLDPTICIDPGQNNEGFAKVRVVARVLGAPGGGKHGHVTVPTDGVAGIDRRGRLQTGNVQAWLYRPFEYRVLVKTDVPSYEHSYVLVYDGDPASGGQLIGGKQVHVGDPRGVEVWFEWQPQTKGQHRLYAKALQHLDDPLPGDNIGILKVEVVPLPRSLTR